MVDSGAAENVLLAGVCNHVKLSATRRSDAGIGFRGAGGKTIRNHGQRKFKVRMRDGHVAGTTWQVADVKRPLMSVAKMVAAGYRVHFDSKDPRIVRPKGDVFPLQKAGNAGKMQPAGGWVFTGMPECRSLPHRWWTDHKTREK